MSTRSILSISGKKGARGTWWLPLLLGLTLVLGACEAESTKSRSSHSSGCSGADCDATGGTSDDAPATGEAPNFEGEWRGTLQELTTGNFGEVTLTIAQEGSALSGTWSALFESGTANGGDLQGMVNPSGNAASFALDSSLATACPLEATLALTQDEAEGNYATAYCSLLLTGTIHVWRDGPDGPGYDPDPPEAPAQIAIGTADQQASVCWSPSAGATGYALYWSESPGVTVETGTREAPVYPPFNHFHLVNGRSYHYAVTGTNLGGEGPLSQEQVATPEAGGGTNAADIVLVLDVTGSMGQEIAGVVSSVLTFVADLRSSALDVRLGAIAYTEDVVDFTPLSADLEADGETYRWLSALALASGSRENFLDPIAFALDTFDWRAGAAREFLILTDEPTQERDSVSATTAWTILSLYSERIDGVARVHAISPGTLHTADARQLAELSGGSWTLLPGTGLVDLSALPVTESILATCSL